MSSPPDRAALIAALGTLRIRAEVDADGTLAVLRATPLEGFPDEPTRRAIVEAARAAGFTTVAWELQDRPAPWA